MKKEINYSQKIKELRISKGLTQREFAQLFGIPLKTYISWEEGKSGLKSYIYNMMNIILKN